MANPNILGAVYGLADVTLQVRSLVQNNTLRVVANNATFGDSWPGTRKSLVLVYQQGNRPPQVGIIQENNAAMIWPDSGTTTSAPAPAPDGQLTILGAAYGLADVTDKVRGLISGNSLQVTANNSTFGDQWPGVDKTLVVVYQFNGIPLVRIAQENSVLQIMPLAILGATYGPEIITAQLSTFIDPFQEVHLPAPSTVFVDPWPGNSKSLAVIYQYGSEQPQTVMVKDTDPLTITYTPHAPFQGATDPTHLQILGAAYSLADVTAQVSGAVQNNSVVVRAENGIFNVDPWPLVVKTLTVVYQYGNGAPRVKNCVEHQQLQILAVPNYGLRLANQAFVSGSVYNFGTGSLTLEAWIQTTQPGPIITFRQRDQVGTPALENLALGIDQVGDITFSLTGVDASGNKINLQTASSTAATPLLDGQWHHVAVVRNGSTLLIYIDGDPLALTQPNPQGPPADLSAAATLYLGVGEPIPAGGPPVFAQNHFLTGAIDEVRFWNVARPQARIQDGMHHQLTDRETGLVGHWTFDLQNLADSSPTNATLSATGAVSYFASDLDIEPAGQPYLITQAELMQDYIPDPDHAGQFREISGYRVMVTARDEFGNPFPSTVTIWAADPSAPAKLYFFDGASAIVTDQTPVNRNTNAQGEVSFVIDAANLSGQPSSNALICPMIKLNASFMAAGHRLVISPDRHVHATLANLTGDQLLGRQALPSGKTAPLLDGQYANQANAAAQAISRVMNSAVDQNVQPERPVTRKRGVPLDEALSQPAIPEYEKVGLLTTPYDFRSNGVGTYFLAADEPQGLTRILVAENMADSYWEVDFGTASSATRDGAEGTAVGEASFTVLSVAERNSRIAALNVTHLDDYTQMFNNQITVSTTMAQLLAIAQAEDTPSNRQKRWFGESFLDKVTGATRIIVTTVTAAVTDAAETVKNLVVTVVDAVGQAVDSILQTVEDALNFAVALLKKFGVLIANIVDFVKSLFNWDDILQTQKVLREALTQMRTLAQSALDAMESKVDTALTSLQNAINTQFNSWVTALSGKTANQQTGPAKNQPPQDLQSKYVMSLYADNLSTAQDDANTPVLDNAFATQLNQTWAQQFPDSSVTPLQNTVLNSGIEAYLVSPESLLNSGLAQVLALLQSAITGLVSLVQSAVHALFGFLKQQIDQIWALCTAPINIPVLSSFYQTTVVPGEQLTMLSLITLAAAIPLTVTYKLVTGQSGSMFTDDDLAAVRNPNWSGYTAITSSIQQTFGSAGGAAGRSVAPAAPDARGVRATAADWVWWGLGGYVYAFSSLAWGICCYIEDSTKNVSKAVTWAKIAFQLLADITCCPAIPLRGTPSPRTAVVWLNWWIWGGGIAALLVNTVTAAAGQLVNTVTAAASQVKLEAFAKWMADKVDPLLTGIYGFLQLIGYSVIFGLSSGVWAYMYFAIGLGESTEWWPQLIKLLALVQPNAKLVLGLLVARIELIGYGIVFGGYAALTSALIAQVCTSADGGAQAAFA